jgi:hypothetical protein
MRFVIQFDSAGNGKALWTEAIPLAKIGKLQVRRASSVEFNGATQKWEVMLAGQRRVNFAHRSRAKCIQWEIRHLQGKLLK